MAFGEMAPQSPSSVPMNSAMGASQSPQESGILSTMKELVCEISDNANITANIEAALGISIPEKEPATSNRAPDQSLVQVLRSAIYRVRNSNDHLSRILGHINS